MKLSVVQEQEVVSAAPAVITIAKPEPLVVLKFGSSVLQTVDDLPKVAGEIYRQRRKGKKIIAVVSALAGETDWLFKEAAHVSAGANCSGVSELVSLGEDRTAALLKIACEKIGVPAAICRAEKLGLHASGSELDADFDWFLSSALLKKLEASGVVIVPGFVGLSDDGERKLLGRGGSDFTAVILGGELGVETVRLYKDVDGVFEDDPATTPAARKYDEVSYQDALRVAQQLVHSKALKFAADRRLPIEVETIGSNSPTRIGAKCRIADCGEKAPPIRVALAGYGVVGQALAKRLSGDSRFQITSILVRDLSRNREVPPPVRLTNDVTRFSKTDADVLIELLSCDRTGAALSCAGLRKGISVVTASKRMVSENFLELAANAAAGRAELLYSAAVGGSSPLLEAIDRIKAVGTIAEVRGILNGTVNFILSRLHEGMEFATALNLARKTGFAEEDCEADLSGADAASKLRIIAHRALGLFPHGLEVKTQTLDEQLAEQIQASSERWVQLSKLVKKGGAIHAEVGFCPALEAGIWAAPDEWNCASIRLEDGQEFAVRGRGAGGAATAEAVLADLYDLVEKGLPNSNCAEPLIATAICRSPLPGQGHGAL